LLASVTDLTFDVNDIRRTRPCYKTNPPNRVFHDSTAVHTISFSFCLAESLSMGVHAGTFYQTDDSSSSGGGGEAEEAEAPTATV